MCNNQTLHSFAGCGVPSTVQDFEKCWRKDKKRKIDNRKKWRDLAVLIIDEIRYCQWYWYWY
jgi:hypothetical protein